MPLPFERAVRSAVERERVAKPRKLEQRTARFRQLATALASTGQSERVKALVEEVERGVIHPTYAIIAISSSLNNRRSERTAKPMNDRIRSAKSLNLNGPFKFSSGDGEFSPFWCSLRRRKHGAGGGLTGYAATSWGIQQLFGRPTLARTDRGRWR